MELEIGKKYGIIGEYRSRKNAVYIDQNVYIFDKPIEENICFGKPYIAVLMVKI